MLDGSVAPFAPFIIAGGVLAGLVTIEVAAGLSGASFLGGADLDADGDGDAGPLDWLNRGRLPLSMLMMLFLGLFAAVGIAVQGVALSSGTVVPTLGAVAIAAGVGLLTLGEASRVLAKIMPKDETYATDAQELIGLTGAVTLAPAPNTVGRVRVVDRHGNAHFPLIRSESTLTEGASVTLIAREGRIFLAAPAQIGADTSILGRDMLGGEQ